MNNKYAATSFADGLENLISQFQLINIKYEGKAFSLQDALATNKQATELAQKIAEFSEDMLNTVIGENLDLFRNKYGDL